MEKQNSLFLELVLYGVVCDFGIHGVTLLETG